MPKFAANLSMLYPEYPFLDRFAAAADDGFAGVECLFPYDVAANELAARLNAHGLTMVLINTPPGDPVRGDRGLGSLPGRQDDFKRAFEQALSYVDVLGNRCLHVMAGCVSSGASREAHRATFVENLAWAGEQTAGRDLTLVIEPINTRDIPGYFLNRQDEAHAICRDTANVRIKVQMDFYHCQIVEGDLATKLQRYAPGIGHIQIAGVPERHEPDHGEINYPYLFKLIDDIGYTGWVAGEYRPRGKTRDGLVWRNYR